MAFPFFETAPISTAGSGGAVGGRCVAARVGQQPVEEACWIFPGW